MQDDPLAPVTLVVGAEELLVDRAIGDVVRAVRAQDPEADVRDLAPGALQAGMLSELASPSLFGERKVIVIRSAQDLGTDLVGEVTRLIADPADEIVLVLAHLGGPKGKKLLDAVRKVGVREVACPKVTKVGDRIAFARAEFRVAGRSLTEDACRTLVEAIGNDLRELASACSQLMADVDGVVDEEVVSRYYSGVAEASSFTVADKAVEGRTAEALEQLRWALSVGVAPVMVTSALAQSVRQIARVGAAPGTPDRTIWRAISACRRGRSIGFGSNCAAGLRTASSEPSPPSPTPTRRSRAAVWIPRMHWKRPW